MGKLCFDDVLFLFKTVFCIYEIALGQSVISPLCFLAKNEAPKVQDIAFCDSVTYYACHVYYSFSLFTRLSSTVGHGSILSEA